MAFVCKQTAVLGVRINNNAVLTDLWPFFSLNTLPYTLVSQTSCIPIVFSVLNILTHMPLCCVLGHLVDNPMT